MKTIQFERPAAFVTLREALSLGGRYWRATWDRWLLAVLAVGIASGLVTWLFPVSAVGSQALAQALMPGTAGALDPSALPALLAGPLAVGLVGLVADWFLIANAVAGLRGREVTGGWVLSAGLRTLLAVIAVSFAATTVLMLMLALGVIGLGLVLVAFPALIYLAIRLQFWMLGVFDGLGVGGGLRTSWALTRHAVLRVVGWWLALFVLSLGLSVIDAVVGAVLGTVAAVPAAVSAGLTTTFQAFTTIVFAILYESQRQRQAGVPAAAYPSASLGQAPDDTYDPSGPEPPPPPADPWRG